MDKDHESNQKNFTLMEMPDDEKNMLIIVDDFLEEVQSKEFIESSKQIERKQGKGLFGTLEPRKQVCYTVDGVPYNYSRKKHYTSKYPEYVKKILPLVLQLVRRVKNDNKFTKLSTAVDIVYDETIHRGGSIGEHSDDECDWGMVGYNHFPRPNARNDYSKKKARGYKR